MKSPPLFLLLGWNVVCYIVFLHAPPLLLRLPIYCTAYAHLSLVQWWLSTPITTALYCTRAPPGAPQFLANSRETQHALNSRPSITSHKTSLVYPRL